MVGEAGGVLTLIIIGCVVWACPGISEALTWGFILRSRSFLKVLGFSSGHNANRAEVRLFRVPNLFKVSRRGVGHFHHY